MQEKARTAPTIHVGIDVSKAHLDVHLHPLGERLRVTNDAHGHHTRAAALSGFRVWAGIMGK